MLVPRPPSSLDTGWDKLNHVLAFAGPALAGLLARSRQGHAGAAGLLGALLLWGLALELLQSQLPPRQGDPADLLADAIGLLVGALLYRSLRSVLRRVDR
jgi:VanZ family protein